MTTTKKKSTPKKPAQKPRSMPAKATKPKPEARKVIAEEPKSSKKAQLHALLKRPEGATIEEMAKQSSWQNHTVRGFLSMLKKAGTNITSERANDERRYRIGDDAAKAEASA